MHEEKYTELLSMFLALPIENDVLNHSRFPVVPRSERHVVDRIENDEVLTDHE
jgi:hypothetical protein